MHVDNVSIIIPTYNRLNILKETVNSIFHQTFQNWELIIVDDMSTPETRSYVEALMKVDHRVRYFRNDSKRGPSGSKNVGITNAKFDYVFFVDDDLPLMPDVLEIITDDFDKLTSRGKNVGGITPAAINTTMEEYKAIQNGDKVNDRRNLSCPCRRSKFTGLIFKNFSPNFKELQEVCEVEPCSLHPKRVFLEAGLFDEIRYKGNYLHEDSDMSYRIWKKGYSFYFEPSALMCHVHVTSGGCRVSRWQYWYYYLLNHSKYLIKNYGSRSAYMIPMFLGYITISSTYLMIRKRFRFIKNA